MLPCEEVAVEVVAAFEVVVAMDEAVVEVVVVAAEVSHLVPSTLKLWKDHASFTINSDRKLGRVPTDISVPCEISRVPDLSIIETYQ